MLIREIRDCSFMIGQSAEGEERARPQSTYFVPKSPSCPIVAMRRPSPA